MATGPFAAATNSLITFRVPNASLVVDADGFVRPGTASSAIQLQAALSKVGKPQVERREGVDTNAFYLRGPLTGVVGAANGKELIMPTILSPNSLGTATWDGLEGRFWLEYTPLPPILQLAGDARYLLAKVEGWFLPGSCSVPGDPWFDRFA